mgnify:CR=1 FL=1
MRLPVLAEELSREPVVWALGKVHACDIRSRAKTSAAPDPFGSDGWPRWPPYYRVTVVLPIIST